MATWSWQSNTPGMSHRPQKSNEGTSPAPSALPTLRDASPLDEDVDGAVEAAGLVEDLRLAEPNERSARAEAHVAASAGTA